ncbi:isocitrate/isopropylmalate family dehydrogenase [Tepidiforma sp.]|uniref:isocitrate/isopropylmalate family dehydrogenase n=1 Tax=Tepidiforma sp. TaxID=2682230 RepID=UPI002ADE2AB8|nr:isocitrate/isopropylmalate family dehydrogenase [Tepidiforma sp.]
MREVAELNGDGIAGELRDAVHLVNEALGSPVAFRPIDWSLERREASPAALEEGIEAVRALGAAMKYPTVTETVSPNQVLRDRLGLAVIHRPCRSYPGVSRNYTGTVDIHVVRVATGGTYEDAGMRIGYYSAVSIRVMERTPVEHAAHFAFRLAESRRQHVVSTSKYTIQRAADGLFEDVVDEVAAEYRNVTHSRELFDALLAKLIINPERYDVIVCPNEYGDFLSDMAYGLIGSIGLGASASYAFSKSHQPIIGVFDPAGGTAPDIAGKGLANPSGALEAFGYLLQFCGRAALGRQLVDAVHDTIAAGETTRDLGGTLGTLDFTRAVIRRLAPA